MKAMQKNDFLSRLEEEQINMMVELLVCLDRCPGDEVIKEGTEGDSLYIVAGVLRMLFLCMWFYRIMDACVYK